MKYSLLEKVLICLLTPFFLYFEIIDHPTARWWEKVEIFLWNASMLFLIITPLLYQYFNIYSILNQNGIDLIQLNIWTSLLFLLLMFVGNFLWVIYAGWG
jgi:hypothetical protein